MRRTDTGQEAAEISRGGRSAQGAVKDGEGAGTVAVQLEVEEGRIGGESAKVEAETAEIELCEADRAVRGRRCGQTRLAATVELVILGRREGNQNVIADKFKMVSSELPEAVEAAEGVIDKNDSEQSSE